LVKNLFNRYIWLVDVIDRAGKITYDEINRKWLRTDWSEGKDLPLRTFHNHREAIQDLFDININCDRRDNNRYYIENEDDIKRCNVRKWLLNTFTVNNLILESHHVKHRILFEDIPSGQQFLTPVIEAMQENLRLEIVYQPFWHDEPIPIIIDPYSLKIFKQRWYVIGKDVNHHAIKTYSLDRIQHIRITETPFQIPVDFNPESWFENSFGIIKYDEVEPCQVQIKVSRRQRKYFQTLPLHTSQEEIETKDDYSVFAYFIAPTTDFKMELLSYGSDIEVLSPDQLRSEIAGTVKKMNKFYK